jgi:hypothetical protein
MYAKLHTHTHTWHARQQAHTHTQTHTHAHKQGVVARTTTLPLAHKNTCRQCAAYMLIWQLQGLFWQRQGLVYALLATSRSRICPFGNIKVCHEEQLLLSHYESVPPSSGAAHRAELLDKVLVKEWVSDCVLVTFCWMIVADRARSKRLGAMWAYDLFSDK